MDGQRRPVVGELRPPFEDVHRIAVLRGGGLGDLIFALPAAEALAAAYPGAEITLLGMPMHAALLAGRPSPFSRVLELPAGEGIRPGREDHTATAAFLERLRSERFDLAVQLHGGGRFSNPFLLELGARHTVGTRTPDAVGLERWLPYLYYQHEVLRHLEVVALAGAVPVDLEPRMRLTADEQDRTARTRTGPPLVVLHPGATDDRRRWPAASFAALAARLAADGTRVEVVGDGTDVATAAEIVAGARAAGAPPEAVRSLAGELSLPQLLDRLLAADAVVANDSGPRHLAAAVGTATVGIYWFGNVVNAGQLSRGRHRIQLGWATACPVCGRDVTQVGWTAVRCEHDESFVADVRVEAVLEDLHSLLGADAAGVG